MNRHVRVLWSLSLLLSSAFMSTAALAQSSLPPRIKIGVLDSLSGGAATASASASQPVIRLLQKELAASGGTLAGRPVDFVFGDNQSDPTQTVTEARRLVDREKVNVMIGPFISTFTLAAAPIYTEARVPSIVIAVSSAFTPQVSPYGFVAYYDASLYTKFMIDYLIDTLHAKSAAIISSNGALDKSAVEGFQKAAAARNFTITGVEQHEFRAADITPNLLNLRRGNPDVLLQQASTAEEGGLVIKTLGEIGWKVPVASHTAVLFAPTWMKMAGPDIFKSDSIHGLTFGNYLACKDSPQFSSPFAKFLQRVKESDPQNFDKFLQLSMSYYYDPIRLMFAAIDATKSVDGPTMAAWIENNAASFPSITGPMAPSKTNHFLYAGNAMWMVTRPDVRRPDGLLNKPGC